MRRHCVFLSLVLIGALLPACGFEKKPAKHSTEHSSNDAMEHGEARDEIIKPPKEYYDGVMRYELSLLDSNSASADRPILFLDFDGATIPKGYDIGQSFIVCSKQGIIPASPFSDTEKDEIVSRVAKFYLDAGSNLRVTRVQPSKRPYDMIVVGGSMGSLGCSENSGILGVAPYDVGNINKNDIGFAFTKYYDDVGTVAETIAHEAGHTFGLDHVNESHGLMYYANSPNMTGFIVGTVRGGKKQDEPTILQRDVGKATGDEDDTAEVPTPTTPKPTPTPVPIPVPTTPPTQQNDPISDPGQILDGLAGIFGGIIPNLGGGNLGGLIGSIFGGLIPGGGTGTPIGGLAGLDQILGIITGLQNGKGTPTGQGLNIGGIADVLSQLGGGGKPLDLDGLLGNLRGGQQIPTPTQIPDLAGLLNLGSLKNLPDLLSSLRSSSTAARSYSGNQRVMLNTFLKAAYAQAYQKVRP